jgi:hypothetical protein
MVDVDVNIYQSVTNKEGVSTPVMGVIVGDPLPNPLNPTNGNNQHNSLAGLQGGSNNEYYHLTLTQFNNLGTYKEAVERANNTVIFDQNYIIGNSGARSGNILFDFTGAKLGAWTEMKHNDGSAFTFPTEAMLMFDSGDISTTVDNFFLFVMTKTSSTQIVKVFHALEGGV